MEPPHDEEESRERVTILDPTPSYLDREFYERKWIGKIHRWWEERWG